MAQARALRRSLLILAGALVGAHATVFLGFTIDDAFITFTYAKNLALGHGPVFVPGVHVEATSSMLWAVLLAPFEAVGSGGAIIGSKVLGMLSLVGAGAVGVLLVEELLPSHPQAKVASLYFGFLFAGASPLVVWATYGMENGVVALIMTAAVLLLLRERRTQRGYLSAFLVFLLVAVRPEGYMYVLPLAGFRLLASPGRRTVEDMRWVGLLCGCLVCYEVFGFAYYGHLLPNTVAAKVGGVSSSVYRRGLVYVLSGAARLYSGLLAFSCATLLLLLLRSLRSRTFAEALREVGSFALVLALLAIQWAFAVAVGGDWMPSARFLSSTIPLLLALTVSTVFMLAPCRVATCRSPREARTWHVLGVTFLGLFWLANLHSARQTFAFQSRLQGAEDRALLGMATLINRLAGSARTVVACSDIGRMGYYLTGEVLDWWGLADAEITQKGQSLGRVDPAVVLQREPEFIVLYSNERTLRVEATHSDMAVYSTRFLDCPGFVQNYRQVASLYFWDARWHVLFRRNAARVAARSTGPSRGSTRDPCRTA